MVNFGKFGVGGEALTSFDYVDISDGTGVEVFNLGTTNSNTVSGAVLRSDTFYSNTVTTGTIESASGAVFLKFNDVDFDVELNLPRNLKGTVLVNMPSGILESDDDNFHSFIYAKLRKWDGTTEEDIVSASGSVLSKLTGGAGTYKYAMDAIIMDAPLTHFKKGETLRLTIEQWGKAHDPGLPNKGATFFIGHDPQGRATTDRDVPTFGTDPSIATVQIPFKIDV